MKNPINLKKRKFEVIIVGAGPAGLGVAILLQKLSINYCILEKHSVGASFKKWPKETRFISPSFTGNFFKMPDLNAISPDTSPAFSLLTEHPSGTEYAQYLQDISEFYELSIQEGIEVQKIQKKSSNFVINTNSGIYTSSILIWAGGEYQYPKTQSFTGDYLCIHYSNVDSFASMEGNERIVIGAYESGFDSAVNLVKQEKKVTLLDGADYLDLVNSDSSYSLSPFTRDRIKDCINDIEYHKQTRVKEVSFDKGKYIVKTSNHKKFISDYKPINCTGFDNSLKIVKDLFDFEEGYPLLNDFDESTRTKNLFLVGPQVTHGSALFCFIYKYRQRFAIIAEKIAKKNKLPSKKIKEVIQEYKDNNFYLKDLSCCGDECSC